MLLWFKGHLRNRRQAINTGRNMCYSWSTQNSRRCIKLKSHSTSASDLRLVFTHPIPSGLAGAAENCSQWPWPLLPEGPPAPAARWWKPGLLPGHTNRQEDKHKTKNKGKNNTKTRKPCIWKRISHWRLITVLKIRWNLGIIFVSSYFPLSKKANGKDTGFSGF